MNAEYFLDTNILLYCFDGRSPEKRRIARDLVMRAVETGKGVISWQVCQEFLHAALHKASTQVPASILEDYRVEVLAPLCRVHSTDAVYSRALEIHRATGYRFYDSLVVAAAMEAGASVLFSEDLQDGRSFGRLRIENPFR
jgi:predicted nucleic acid-binding protein